MQGTDRRFSGNTKVLERAAYPRQPRATLTASRKMVLETFGCFPHVCEEIAQLLDVAP